MPYINYYKNNSFPAENELPFAWLISFKKLINWWEEQAALPDSIHSDRAREVLKRIEKIPRISEPFSDVGKIEMYCEEINLLLSPFFPSLTTTKEIKGVSLPFKQMLFNVTSRFTHLLEEAQDENLVSEIDANLIYMFSCMTILNEYYKTNINISPNLFFKIRNKQTLIVHKYKALINFDFTEIHPLKNAKTLTDKDVFELTSNFGNIEFWKKKISPQSFRFEGFTIMTLFEVTHDESISALKFDLLKKDALTSQDIVGQIQESLSALLNIPGIKTGFISYNKESNLLQSVGLGIWNSIVLSDQRDVKINKVFRDHTKTFSFKNNDPFILQIDGESADENILIQRVQESGLKSYIAIPLFYSNQLIGILELGSDQLNALNMISVYKLRETLPLFIIAMKRSQDETKNQLDAIILQKFTAIQPSVAWRFMEAAEKILEARMHNIHYQMEEIVFPGVYPLYGESDIKGSSVIRNSSIRADLLEQLSLANTILNLVVNKLSIRVYKNLRYRVAGYIEKLQRELSTGDENLLDEFFKDVLSPAFKHLITMGGEIGEALQQYENQLDPVLGMLYNKRKDYDLSVKIVNEHISGYFDKVQPAAQNMFPHYFEKSQSDGVGHNLYIGQSMINDKTFHQGYVQNLRLWQLMVTCEVENEIDHIRRNLKSALQICSLILVYSQPLSIGFRMEEKKFDVSGAYNAHYEIIKNRIGKSMVKESGERLTQPGKIAIIYSYDKEAKEYLNYIRYLQSIQYITDDIEWLTIKDLQGVTGLRAIRVSVLYHQGRQGQESKAVELLKENSLK